MLEYSGPYKGEFVERQLLTAKDIIDLFKLPIRMDKTHRLRLNPKRRGVIAKNRADNTERYSDMRQMSPTVSGTHKGLNINFTLRYFQTRNPTKNNTFNYYPNRIQFTGKETKFTEDKIEELIIFYLSPWCGDSPLQSRKGQGIYYLHDADEAAKEELKTIAQDTQLNQYLLSMNADLSMYLAKAINQLYGSIPNDDLSDPSAAKVALIKLYKNSPDTIRKAMSSKQVEAATLMFQAIEEGKIEYHPNQQGLQVWKYTEDSGGAVICKLDRNKGMYRTMIDYLSSGLDTMQEFRSNIGADNLQKSEEDSSEGTATIKDGGFSNPAQIAITKAVSGNIIGFHPGECKVYFKNSNGQFEGRALKVLPEGTDVTEWQDVFAEEANDQIISRIESKLEAE